MRKKPLRIHQYLLLGANEMCHISAKKKRKNAARIFFYNRFQAVCLAAWHDRVRGQAFAVRRIALPKRPTITRITPIKSALRTVLESQPSHTSYPLVRCTSSMPFITSKEQVQEQQLLFPISLLVSSGILFERRREADIPNPIIHCLSSKSFSH